MDEEESRQAFLNNYDFDSPDAVDFDLLVSRLRDLKAGYGLFHHIAFRSPLIKTHRKKAEIPIYSFEKHARETKTTSIYSPHVLILEGIFALCDPRVLDLLDMKVFFPPALDCSGYSCG